MLNVSLRTTAPDYLGPPRIQTPTHPGSRTKSTEHEAQIDPA